MRRIVLGFLVAFAGVGIGCAPAPGEAIDSVGLALPPPPGPDDAAVVYHDLPTDMNCGETRNVTVSMINIGEDTWQPGQVKLGAFTNTGPFTAPSRIDLASAAEPGDEAIFHFALRAPETAIYAPTKWRMRRESNSHWFGEIAEEMVNVTCNGPELDAAVVGSNFPTNVGCEDEFDVSVTFQNRGSHAWLPSELTRLGAAGDDDPFYDDTRVPLDVEVQPGESHTFQMHFRAPPGPGDYATDWQMVRDEGGPWFGDIFRRTISVSCEPGVDAAEVTTSMPNPVACMEHFAAHVNVRNVGTTTWRSPGGAHGYYLGLTPDSVPIAELFTPFPPNVSVPPGASYTFTVSMHAPAPPDGYYVAFQMINRDRNEFFGERDGQTLTVSCTQDNARIVDMPIPLHVGCGLPFPLRVIVKNTGLSTWDSGSLYRLGNANGTTAFLPPTLRIELPPGLFVPPGTQVTFEKLFTAPAIPGFYGQSWQMVKDGGGSWFGETALKFVEVSCQPDVAEATEVNLPTTLGCGQTYAASITMKNMGSANWLNFTGYKLGAVGGSDPFGPPVVLMPIDVAAQPGESHTFRFPMVAPYRAETLRSDWQMLHGTEAFGPVVARDITVECPSLGARVVSVEQLERGDCEPEVEFLVTMRNAGLRTWGVDAGVVPDRWSLAEVGAPNPFAVAHEVVLEDGKAIVPGGTATFRVRLRRGPRGPSEPTFWRMSVTPGGATRLVGGPRKFGATARIRVPRPCWGAGLDAQGSSASSSGTEVSPGDAR